MTNDIMNDLHLRFWDLKKGAVRSSPIERSRKPKPSSVFAVDWLDGYFCLFGDRLPDRPEFSLPSCLTKTAIFQQYEAEVVLTIALELIK